MSFPVFLLLLWTRSEFVTHASLNPPLRRILYSRILVLQADATTLGAEVQSF